MPVIIKNVNIQPVEYLLIESWYLCEFLGRSIHYLHCPILCGTY